MRKTRYLSIVVILLLILGNSLFAKDVNDILTRVKQLRQFLAYSPKSGSAKVSAADSLAVANRKAEIQKEIDALLASSREDYSTRDVKILGYIQDKGVLSLDDIDLGKHLNIRMTQQQADTVTRNPQNFYLTAVRELNQSLDWGYYNWTLKGYNVTYYEEPEPSMNIPDTPDLAHNDEPQVEIDYIFAEDPAAKTGVSYYDSGDYENSLQAFLNANQGTTRQRPVYYYWIAMNYMNLGDITNAKFYLEKYLATMDRNYRGEAETYLAILNRQQSVFRRVVINNYPEYLTSDNGESHFTVSPDGNYLYFSSLRPASLAKANIWRAEKLNNIWGYPVLVSDLSTNSNEALCSFSSDGKRAYLMGSYEKAKTDVDIYYSDWVAKWSAPTNIQTVNSPAEDIDPYVYNDKLMFFSSTREGGFGGYDLYLSVYANGVWQKPFNLGANVNTSGDEFAPFMDWDGKTLFFASNGFTGFGGCDIYKAVVLNSAGDEWSVAENVGAPINTNRNDSRFYHIRNSNEAIVLTDRSRADRYLMRPLSLDYAPRSYYITENNGDRTLKMDTDATSPLSGLLATPDTELKTVMIRGTITNEKKEPLLAEVQFSYTEDGVSYSETARSTKEGNYLITLPRKHKYHVECNLSGYSLYSTDFLPGIEVNEFDLNLVLLPMDMDKVFVYNNILFDYDSAVIKKESHPVLNEIAITLLNSPTIRVEISGHTCENSGGEKYNNKLSKDRAESVIAYLVSKGVAEKRMIAKGYGLSKPIADNKTEEGKAMNRRVEVKRIK